VFGSSKISLILICKANAGRNRKEKFTQEHVTGPARGFGYTVSRAFFTKVFGIFCQNSQVYGILYYNNFRYLLSTFLHFYGILVSQGKEMRYIGIPLAPLAGPVLCTNKLIN